MAKAGQDGVTTFSKQRPCLVTFSGIDGAGKTTQIDAALGWLREAGFRTRRLRFWDDIATLGPMREFLSHTLYNSEKGIGSPGKPVERRDKNVRGWYMTLARLFLYSLDAARLTFAVAAASRANIDVVVFDRYLYDQLANLDLDNAALRAYARLLLKMAPHPDIAFLLDADPAQAQTRKPEYPLEFVQKNRAAYLALAKLADMTVIGPLAVQDVTDIVLRELSSALLRAQTENLSHSLPLATPDHQ